MNYWKDVANQKKFFDEFAESKGFDPLEPDNWYSVKRTEVVGPTVLSFFFSLSIILILTQGSRVMGYYRSFEDALRNIYPNIGLESDKFHTSMLVPFVVLVLTLV